FAVLGEVVNTHDAVSACEEFLHEVTADEPRGSADQYLLHCYLFSSDFSIDRVRSLSSSTLSPGPKANRYHRRYLGSQAVTWKFEMPSCRSSQIVGISAIGRRRRPALGGSSMPILQTSRLSMPTARTNAVE